MQPTPDEFEVYLFQVLMILTILFGLFGGLGWAADVLERWTEKKGRRAADKETSK